MFCEINAASWFMLWRPALKTRWVWPVASSAISSAAMRAMSALATIANA